MYMNYFHQTTDLDYHIRIIFYIHYQSLENKNKIVHVYNNMSQNSVILSSIDSANDIDLNLFIFAYSIINKNDLEVMYQANPCLSYWSTK